MDFALLGICYDRTQTFRRGSAKGPQILRSIFPKLETYIRGIDLTDSAFIKDLGDIHPETLEQLMSQTSAKLRGLKQFPIILGGEHTVTLGAVKELKPDVLVVLDAHPDCEDSNGHNGVVRRISEMIGPENIYMYGIRCMSRKEEEFIKEKSIKVASLKDLSNIEGRAYLSIDYDVLDPSIVPAVGNPEPDGITVNNLLEAVRALGKNLAAVDFVEFTPLSSSEEDVYTLLAGKVIYATLAEIVRAKGFK